MASGSVQTQGTLKHQPVVIYPEAGDGNINDELSILEHVFSLLEQICESLSF